MRARIIPSLLFLAAAGFFLLHFLHLRADFPNHSPWVDWAKYTDEGWYGDAAIRHFLRGTWRLPGDFNPAVALPVWPLLEAVVFRFFGVSIVSARALAVCVFGGVILCSVLLLRLPLKDASSQGDRERLAAAAALMLAASPFLYVFSRMAILEPLLVLLLLLCLLVAYRVGRCGSERQRLGYAVGLGALVAAMIATKTTAVALLPGIGWMLADSVGFQWKRVAKLAGLAVVTTALLWGGYLLVLAHHGYLEDFRYLFTANQYTGITLKTFWPMLWQTLTDSLWIGRALCLLVLVAIAAGLARREIRRDPVFVSLLLAAAGYLAFMVWHANTQPRYFMVIAVPATLLVARVGMHRWQWRLLPCAVLAAMVAVAGWDGAATLRFARHPEFSFQRAAERLEQIVESDPAHSHTVLSISGSQFSLMTGLPSICDDFGTMSLENRIAAYKPGWFVTWNFVEDDKMAALSRFYRLTRVAEFPAMDDPDRNLMIVYRLDANEGVTPQRRRPGKRVPPAKERLR